MFFPFSSFCSVSDLDVNHFFTHPINVVSRGNSCPKREIIELLYSFVSIFCMGISVS